MAMTLSFRGKQYYILASPNEDMEAKFKYLILVIPKTMGGLIFFLFIIMKVKGSGKLCFFYSRCIKKGLKRVEYADFKFTSRLPDFNFL